MEIVRFEPLPERVSGADLLKRARCVSIEAGRPLHLKVSGSVCIQQLQACGLETMNYHAADAFHEFIAQLRVFLAQLAKEVRMEIQRTRWLVRPSIEMPLIRLEQPGPP
jgi:hypothetical protein